MLAGVDPYCASFRCAGIKFEGDALSEFMVLPAQTWKLGAVAPELLSSRPDAAAAFLSSASCSFLGGLRFSGSIPSSSSSP